MPSILILDSDKFRAARLEAELSREEAAIKIGLSATTITYAETGRQFPGKDALLRMASVYGCKLDDFCREQWVPEPMIDAEARERGRDRGAARKAAASRAAKAS